MSAPIVRGRLFPERCFMEARYYYGRHGMDSLWDYMSLSGVFGGEREVWKSAKSKTRNKKSKAFKKAAWFVERMRLFLIEYGLPRRFAYPITGSW